MFGYLDMLEFTQRLTIGEHRIRTRRNSFFTKVVSLDEAGAKAKCWD